MELSGGLDQLFPVLRVLVYVVLAYFLADLLELRVEAHHQFFELALRGHFVTDCHQFLFCLSEEEEGKEDSVGVIGLDDIHSDM